MSDRFLLYIDILGFSDLVENHPLKIERLYDVIDTLNVHQHEAFTTLVFSDTIVVYNKADPRSPEDHSYLVMYSCEFAQDLQYRLVGSNIYFRAFLTYGPFAHRRRAHVESFYGRALVDAYRRERAIQAVGLFMDDICNGYNKIFPTTPYDSGVSFVYLNQPLERLQRLTGGMLPAPPLEEEFTDLLWDLQYLYDVYEQMRHPEPAIRMKYLSTWELLRQRYPQLLQGLEVGRLVVSVKWWKNDRAFIRRLNNEPLLLSYAAFLSVDVQEYVLVV